MTITVKVPPKLGAILEAEARGRRISKSQVVRESLEQLLSAPRKMTALDLVRDLAGSVHGPSDLSTNPKHMEGFGA